MKKVPVETYQFQADDGLIFLTEDECRHHEEFIVPRVNFFIKRFEKEHNYDLTGVHLWEVRLFNMDSEVYKGRYLSNIYKLLCQVAVDEEAWLYKDCCYLKSFHYTDLTK